MQKNITESRDKVKLQNNIRSFLLILAVLTMLVIMNFFMVYNQIDIGSIIGRNLIILCLLSIYGYYIFLFYKEIPFNQKLFLVLITSSLWTASIFIGENAYFFMPILVGVMLIAININQQLAIITHILGVALIGMILPLPMMFYLFYLPVGVLSALVIIEAKERKKIIYVAGLTSLFGVVFYILIVYMMGLELNLTEPLVIFSNILLSIIVVVGSMPLWEAIFQFVTPTKLLELMSEDHKLLQRLMVEAPGTYHHSKMVSNLAQRAAKAVGCDAIMTKIGALYHDVGKLKDPEYFIENQNGGPNPHDQIAAESSAQIIIEHVAFGVKLAKEHKLPKGIVELIGEHHGTSLVGYFYHKANQYDDGIAYQEATFRYPGPKPSTKESAIIMLADCVEAYVTSLDEEDRHLERIREIIKEISNQKFMEAQLDASPLKMKELPLIAEAFIQVYNGMYHERVKYPTNR